MTLHEGRPRHAISRFFSLGSKGATVGAIDDCTPAVRSDADPAEVLEPINYNTGSRQTIGGPSGSPRGLDDLL